MQGINIPLPTPQVRTLYDVLNQKRLQNLATAQVQARAAQDPFQTADTQQLVKDVNTVNQSAADVKENDIPLYNQLKAALIHVPTGTGPLRGRILWTTPQGQYFKSLLTRAQGNYIKNFHLGRMTQREFDLLRSAVGGGTLYSSALQKIFDRQLEQDNQALFKQHFYNEYLNQGGRSSTEASNKWLDALGQQQEAPEKVPKEQQEKQLYSKSLNRPVTEADIEDTMKANNLTRQQVIDKYEIS